MLSQLLFRLTAGLPCRKIDIDGKPYLERYWLGSMFGLTAYLHRFVSGDDERHVHDHPWRWSAALVLAGGYLEERVTALCPTYGWFAVYRRMFPGRVNMIREGDFHRITEPKPETWTLFIHRPRCKSWGFLSRLDAESPDHGMVLYHQPYDTAATHGWHLAAPRGDDANRAPFNWSARHAAESPRAG